MRDPYGAVRAAWLQNPRVAVFKRRIPWFVLDFPIAVAAYVVAYYLRFVDASPAALRQGLGHFLGTMAMFAVAYAGLNYVTRLDQRVWRYAAAGEVVAIAARCVLATMFLLGIDLAIRPGVGRLLPLSILGSGGFFAFSGFVAVRYRRQLVRTVWNRRRLARQRPTWAVKTLIFGAGEAGQLLAWRLLHLSEGSGYSIVGFVDDDPKKLGRSIHGIHVLGNRHDLPRLGEKHAIELIAIAMANIKGSDMRSILTLAQQTEARIKIVPDVFDWMSETVEPMREVQVEDLLGRQPAQVDDSLASEVVSNQVVLVTGAAGSIGSALCRQIARLGPKTLVALDVNESDLFDLSTELTSEVADLDLQIVIADVTSSDRVQVVFEDWHPHVIFHVAAYKHVPLMESFPSEAARVNVLGTWNVLTSARAAGSDRFVLVSTDKAVNPSSMMGASKRVAEMLTSSDPGTPPLTPEAQLLCTAVRFGNVLGSRGSVVPTFSRQIDAGGPITITDAGMTRYFMDVQEAASLIIQAARLTAGQDIFMLEMGDQIRVDDLARKMIRLRGLRPDVDIPIKYVGMRPGEKLQEELSSTVEARTPTAHPSIYRLTRNIHPTHADAARLVSSVEAVLTHGDADEVRRVVHSAATMYQDREHATPGSIAAQAAR